MRTFQEFMVIVEGMTMKDFKANRRKLKRREASADAKKRGHVGKEWYNSGRTYSPDEAKSGRAKLDDAERSTRHRSSVDPEAEDDNYSADKTKNPKKIRKQKAMGELGEAYDKDVMGSSQIRRTGEGGRIGAERKKTTPERRRMKAVGGGKQEPVEYKDRSDIGSQRQTSTRIQQPEQERGSKEVAQTYAQKAKEERKKAAQARIAAKKGDEAPKEEKPKTKEVSQQASKLLSKKKEEKPVSPDYKPSKASGMTRGERMSQQRKGEAMLKDIMKDQEFSRYEKETGQKATGKAKTKLLGRVAQRMAN